MLFNLLKSAVLDSVCVCKETFFKQYTKQKLINNTCMMTEAVAYTNICCPHPPTLVVSLTSLTKK